MAAERGQITIYVIVILISILIVVVGALVGPMGVQFATDGFAMGEAILAQANQSLESVSDSTVKASIMSNINSARTAEEANVEVSSALYKYSWVFVLVLVGLIAFLATRANVERGGIF